MFVCEALRTTNEIPWLYPFYGIAHGISVFGIRGIDISTGIQQELDSPDVSSQSGEMDGLYALVVSGVWADTKVEKDFKSVSI